MFHFPNSSEEFLNGKIILLVKPLGWTSFDIVKKVKNLIRTKFSLKKIKVGMYHIAINQIIKKHGIFHINILPI